MRLRKKSFVFFCAFRLLIDKIKHFMDFIYFAEKFFSL